MNRPSNMSIVAISSVSLLLALILLPGIAGLIEGDFKYLQRRMNAIWNSNGVSLPEALSDIYAWSFWRVGLRREEPEHHVLYRFIIQIRTLEKAQNSGLERTISEPLK